MRANLAAAKLAFKYISVQRRLVVHHERHIVDHHELLGGEVIVELMIVDLVCNRLTYSYGCWAGRIDAGDVQGGIIVDRLKLIDPGIARHEEELMILRESDVLAKKVKPAKSGKSKGGK